MAAGEVLGAVRVARWSYHQGMEQNRNLTTPEAADDRDWLDSLPEDVDPAVEMERLLASTAGPLPEWAR